MLEWVDLQFFFCRGSGVSPVLKTGVNCTSLGGHRGGGGMWKP